MNNRGIIWLLILTGTLVSGCSQATPEASAPLAQRAANLPPVIVYLSPT